MKYEQMEELRESFITLLDFQFKTSKILIDKLDEIIKILKKESE